MRKVTGECSVWIANPEWQKPETMAAHSFYPMSPDADMASSGWVKAGTGKLDYDLFDKIDLVGGQIKGLEAQKNELIQKVWQLDEKIKNLQAISYEPAAEPKPRMVDDELDDDIPL